MENVFVQYQGFHPSEFTQNYLDEQLAEIQHHAPIGAEIRAIFKRRGGELTATLRILSRAGHFFAMAEGPHLREVSHQLTERIHRQLDRWHDRPRRRKEAG